MENAAIHALRSGVKWLNRTFSDSKKINPDEHVPAVVEIWTEGFLAGKIPAMLGTGFWRNPYENERT